MTISCVSLIPCLILELFPCHRLTLKTDRYSLLDYISMVNITVDFLSSFDRYIIWPLMTNYSFSCMLSMFILTERYYSLPPVGLVGSYLLFIADVFYVLLMIVQNHEILHERRFLIPRNMVQLHSTRQPRIGFKNPRPLGRCPMLCGIERVTGCHIDTEFRRNSTRRPQGNLLYLSSGCFDD